MFKKPKQSNLSPQRSTNCCFEYSVKPKPNESIKYLKSIASLLDKAMNKGVPFPTKSRIKDCSVDID